MKAVQRLVLLAGLIPAAICAADGRPPVAAPTQAEIRALEAAILLPPGASPLATYNRHYAAAIQGGGRHIVGVYFDTGGKVFITTLERLPRVLDGGCSVVNVEYDVTANRFLAVTCNGDA